jgi:hypothetical protein
MHKLFKLSIEPIDGFFSKTITTSQVGDLSFKLIRSSRGNSSPLEELDGLFIFLFEGYSPKFLLSSVSLHATVESTVRNELLWSALACVW